MRAATPPSHLQTHCVACAKPQRLSWLFGFQMKSQSDVRNKADVSPRLEKLLERFDRGDKVALARLITLIENHAPERNAVIESIYAKTGHAHIVGITGPPGAGK